MRDIALRALDTARMRGASYADVRLVHLRSQNVVVRNHNVEALVEDESLGFGVRVIVDGYWGFASSNLVNSVEADRVAAEAVKIARASALVRGQKADIGAPMRHTGQLHDGRPAGPLRGELREEDRPAAARERDDAQGAAGHLDRGVHRTTSAR